MAMIASPATTSRTVPVFDELSLFAGVGVGGAGSDGCVGTGGSGG